MTEMPQRMEINEIKTLLPHRYPFLMVDRVLDYQTERYIHALKNLSVNEPLFAGHFPEMPVFPGVMMIEAMAQASGILAAKTFQTSKDKVTYYLASVDQAKFRQPVGPGDQLFIKSELIKDRKGIAFFHGSIQLYDLQNRSPGALVCQAEIKCARRENS